MRYFIDVEPTDNVPDVISLAVVREDGEALYEINEDFDPKLLASWVRNEVIGVLPPTTASPRRSVQDIHDRVTAFVASDSAPRFWSFYADLDWPRLRRFLPHPLPPRFPPFCFDLRQTMAEIGVHNADLPTTPLHEHDALECALWLRGAFGVVAARAAQRGIELP